MPTRILDPPTEELRAKALLFGIITESRKMSGRTMWCLINTAKSEPSMLAVRPVYNHGWAHSMRYVWHKTEREALKACMNYLKDYPRR